MERHVKNAWLYGEGINSPNHDGKGRNGHVGCRVGSSVAPEGGGSVWVTGRNSPAGTRWLTWYKGMRVRKRAMFKK